MIRRALTAIVLACTAVAASASTVTYDFSLTIDSGSLSGNSYTGWFSFDTANNQVLSDFSFTFRGVPYDETTANTGSLSFDSGGALTDFEIGNDCTGSSCQVVGFSSDWLMTASGFTYGDNIPGDLFGKSFSSGPTFALRDGGGNVPEPTSLALVLAAGAFASAFRRRT
jgi:hypothetical protein